MKRVPHIIEMKENNCMRVRCVEIADLHIKKFVDNLLTKFEITIINDILLLGLN